MLQQGDHVRAVLADVLAVMAFKHGNGGVAHLILEPLQRHSAGGQQLAGVGVAAVVRPPVAHFGRCQVRAPKSLEQHVRAAVRCAGAGAVEDEP